MSGPDPGSPDFSALLEVAEAKYDRWRLRESQPERNRRLDALKYQKLTSSGRAVHALRIYRELLELEARKRILYYALTARKPTGSEMLSKRRLTEFRERIMRHVKAALGALKDSVRQDACAAGDVSPSALPAQHRYDQVQYEILNIVNAELRVLEAEGKLTIHGEAVVEAGAPNKRGRPQKIPDERKAAALKAKETGGSNREAAAKIYDTKYPDSQQVKNVPRILQHYQQKLKNPHPSRSAARKRPKQRG
jgi:hypothetical protein